jgi:hypothetical protein
VIHIDSVQTTANDYIVVLVRPDGSKVPVLIPREDSDGYENKAVSQAVFPIGLNLVSEGHYT